MNTPPDDDFSVAEALIANLQATRESDRAQLARAIHDELGGLMVAAAMDLSAASRLVVHSMLDAQAPLDRAKRTLETAIDRSRQMIEE